MNRLESRYVKKYHIPQEVLDAFITYDWPGNIRELENTIEPMFVMSDGAQLNPALLPGEMRKEAPPYALSSFKSVSEAATKNAEKRMIKDVLGAHNQNRTQAAKMLGSSRRTLQNKIKEYDL
jgi:transcriptional regulator with PAS, ATPase and Fis domain